MKPSFFILAFALLSVSIHLQAQSKTTEALSKKYSDATAFFFYNNTLRMLNQNDDKDFDELIKDVEKMRLLMINKTTNFKTDYKKIVSDYKQESFEEMVTSRYDGKSFNIYIRETENKTKGMLVLVNDSSKLYILDILGSIPLNKVTSLFNTIDNSEIAKKIKADFHKN